MTNQNLRLLLQTASKHDICDMLWWNSVLEFYINCNDLFVWGTADGVRIETEEDIALLDKSCTDAGVDGPPLYCARKEKMRPQGACYKHFKKENWKLFNDCGPKRKVGLGNPVEAPSDNEL